MKTKIQFQDSVVIVPRILIVGQRAGLCAALSAWLKAALPPCHVLAVQTGGACLESVRCNRPEAVIVALHLSDMSGIEATQQIKTLSPETSVILFAFSDAAVYRSEAQRAGACGYVLKSRTRHDLLPLLHTALNMDGVICRSSEDACSTRTREQNKGE